MAEILVAGVTGGREHTLGEFLAEGGENIVRYSHGNGGTERSRNLGLDSIEKIVDYAIQTHPDLVAVGPEAPLIDGIADQLREQGIATFGPGADGAQMEGSKAWFAEFADEFDIPQPVYEIVRDTNHARQILETRPVSKYVQKADGQAGGKGAILAGDQKEAEDTFDGMLSGKLFGEAGKVMIVQDRLDPSGDELSAYYVMDGSKFGLVGVARDYKRIGEGDTGKNTGGMGAYSPLEFVDDEIQDQLMDIGERIVHGLKKRNIDYRGVVFLGGMLDVEDGNRVKALEANVRFGDPETQVVIPRLGRMGINLYEMTRDAANGSLDPALTGNLLNREAGHDITFCLAAENYPGKPRTGDEIHGLDRDYEGVEVYHGGTVRNPEGRIVTAGGRILYITASGKTLDEAAAQAQAAIGEENGGIYFTGMQYRKDIGYQARRAA